MMYYTKHHLKFGKNQADNLGYIGFRHRFFPILYWYLVLYSKSAFIRKVLIPHGLVDNRIAGTKDRYNKERIFEGKRYSVISINYNELANYLSGNIKKISTPHQRVLIFTLYP